jgi:hypothetical protein
MRDTGIVRRGHDREHAINLRDQVPVHVGPPAAVNSFIKSPRQDGRGDEWKDDFEFRTEQAKR